MANRLSTNAVQSEMHPVTSIQDQQYVFDVWNLLKFKKLLLIWSSLASLFSLMTAAVFFH